METPKLNLIKSSLIYTLIGTCLGIASAWEPKLLFLAMGLIACGTIFLRPVVGLALMLFLIPMEELTLIVESFTLIKLLGLLTFFSWLLMLFRKKQRIYFNTPTILVIFLFVWSFLSVYWTENQSLTFDRLVILAMLVVFFIMAANMMWSPKNLKFALVAYTLGAAIASVVSIYIEAKSGFALRGSVDATQNPNDMARAIGLGFITAIYLWGEFKNKLVKILLLVSSVIIMSSFLLTGSRGAWVAMAVVLICFILRNKSNKIIIVALLLISIGIAPMVINIIPESITDRFASLSDPVENGAGRLDIWLIGTEMIKDNLVLGVGLGNFPFAFNKYASEASGLSKDIKLGRDPHNVFLSITSELGILGIAFFVLTFAVIFKALLKQKGKEAWLSGELLIFILIAGLFGTDHYRKYYWFALALPVAQNIYYQVKGVQKKYVRR